MWHDFTWKALPSEWKWLYGVLFGAFLAALTKWWCLSSSSITSSGTSPLFCCQKLLHPPPHKCCFLLCSPHIPFFLCIWTLLLILRWRKEGEKVQEGEYFKWSVEEGFRESVPPPFKDLREDNFRNVDLVLPTDKHCAFTVKRGICLLDIIYSEDNKGIVEGTMFRPWSRQRLMYLPYSAFELPNHAFWRARQESCNKWSSSLAILKIWIGLWICYRKQVQNIKEDLRPDPHMRLRIF